MNDQTRDTWAGVLLALLGAGAALYAWGHYEVGSVARMGPGFFPLLTGLGLVLLGLATVAVAQRGALPPSGDPSLTPSSVGDASIASSTPAGGEAPSAAPAPAAPGQGTAFSWRPLLAVLVAMLVFSQTVETLGLMPATCLLTLCAAAAERPYRLKRSLALGVGLALLAWLIFSVGLDMPLPAFAWQGGPWTS